MFASLSNEAKGLALSAAGMILISPDALLVRLAAEAGGRIEDVTFWRVLFIGISILLVTAFTDRRGLLGAIRALGLWGWVSTGILTTTQLGFVAAINLTSVANVLVLLATIPLFAAIAGWLWLKEAVAWRTRLAILAGIAGIVVIVSGSLGGGSLVGDGIALAMAVLYGINLVVMRRAGGGTIMPTLGLSGLIAALVALPFCDPMALPPEALGYVAFGGLIQMPLSLALFFSGTRYIAAAEVGLMALLETVLGPIWAWIGVGEIPDDRSLVGGALVLLALVGNAVAALVRREPAPSLTASAADARTGDGS